MLIDMSTSETHQQEYQRQAEQERLANQAKRAKKRERGKLWRGKA